MNLGPDDSGQHGESPLERRAKALFDASVDAVSPGVAERLARARATALTEVSQHRASWLTARWSLLPRSAQWAAVAGGLAVVSVVGVMLRVGPLLERVPATSGFLAEDVEFVATMNTEGDDIEMLQDLEFYSWLGAEPAAEDVVLDENIG